MSFARKMRVMSLLNRHQEGRCGFCGMPFSTMVLDHDHDTELVRGLLCGGCNSAEGRASADHPEWSAYRTNPPALQAGISVNYFDLGAVR